MLELVRLRKERSKAPTGSTAPPDDATAKRVAKLQRAIERARRALDKIAPGGTSAPQATPGAVDDEEAALLAHRARKGQPEPTERVVKRPLFVEEPSSTGAAEPLPAALPEPPALEEPKAEPTKATAHMTAVKERRLPGHPDQPSPRSCLWCWRDAQESSEAVTAAFEDAKRQHDKRAKNPRGKDDDDYVRWGGDAPGGAGPFDDNAARRRFQHLMDFGA